VVTHHQDRHNQSLTLPGPKRQGTPHRQCTPQATATLHHGDRQHHTHATRATPTMGIATPNLMLSELCRQSTPNAAIPTTRTATPLCQGPHRNCPHNQTPKTLPRDALLPKRPPRLWVTDHHGADQLPTMVEDTIHAMESPTASDHGGGGMATKGTTRSGHRMPSHRLAPLAE
jgi:hypothetical protein